jgi:fatty acid amide hydrolase 2
MPLLTERSAVDLASAIRGRETTSVEVLDAHIEMLVRTGARLNAMVASRFDHARGQATEVDKQVAQTSMRGGDALDALAPLLGVPFTVSESIAVTNMPQTAGLIARRDFRAMETAEAVKRLTAAGAIPMGVTNTSEGNVGIDSENPVFGRTSNPYDETRTAGGASGGEAAAVGSGASPFGVATDSAGSMRIPAMFCGVFGHKPSAGLVPNSGSWPDVSGEDPQTVVIGPVTRKAEDLMPLLRIMAAQPVDQPKPKRVKDRQLELGEPSEVSLDGLVVTVIEDSSLRPMDGALRDARERTVGALASAGAEIRRIKLPSWKRTLIPFLSSLQDGEEERSGVLALLRETTDPGTNLRTSLAGSSGHTLSTKLTLLAEAVPEGFGGRGAKLATRAADLTTELIDAIGEGVLLHPAHLAVAPRHRRGQWRPWLNTPAALFNLAGVPVTEVPLGLTDDGLPVGIQVAAGLGADHLSIAIALELEAVFGGWVPPAAPEA